MNTIRFFRNLAFFVSAIFLTSALAATKSDLDEAMSHDGLSKISVKDLDLVFARPGATLAGYNKIKLEPISVAFSKNWDPKRTGSNIKLSNTERDSIKTKVATLVNEEFTKELQKKDGYPVTNEAGPDVLTVKISIVNLYVNAPDTLSAGRSRTYTVSAGEMTLFMELFDSETGQVLVRVVDRREGRGAGGMMTLSGSVQNAAEASDIASTWARTLRKGLDKAHGIGKK